VHRLDEVDHHLVGHVRADADDEVDGLHLGGLVDAGDVRRRVDGGEVVLGRIAFMRFSESGRISMFSTRRPPTAAEISCTFGAPTAKKNTSICPT
jgi:hypothetical protein